MTENNNQHSENISNKRDVSQLDDNLDEELMALAPPPPSVTQAIFVGIILIFSFLILYLFWPEAKFFIKAFSEPIYLGDVSDIDSNKLESNTYVRIEGVPMVNQIVTFSTGTKWFSGDIYRKMAPLSGNSSIMAQWVTHNPKIRQEKDALTPPSVFTGRLMKREDLSSNYAKFWPFYDCLKFKNTSSCKFCINKKSINECRPIYTCVENYPIEVCDHIAYSNQEKVLERIEKIESGKIGSSDKFEELASLKAAYAAFDDIEILEKQALLLEYYERISILGETQNKDILKLKKDLLQNRFEIIKILFSPVINQIEALPVATKKQVEDSVNSYKEASEKIKKLEIQIDQLRPFRDVNTKLAQYIDLCKELEGRLKNQFVDIQELSSLSLDATADGKSIYSNIEDLESMLAKWRRGVAKDEDNQFKDEDKIEKKADKEHNSRVEKNHEEKDTEALELHPQIQKTLTELEKIRQRISLIGSKIDLLLPDELIEFEEWAKLNISSGAAPKAILAPRVIYKLEYLEDILGNIEEPASSVPLAKRWSKLQKQSKETKQRADELKKISGFEQLELVKKFNHIEKIFSDSSNILSHKAKIELGKFEVEYISKEFYPLYPSNYPNLKEQLENYLAQVDFQGIEAKVENIEQGLISPSFVLLDSEKPGDNLWIIFVFLIIPIMIVINILKLKKFFIAWRQ